METGAVFLQLALETSDEVVLNGWTNLLRGVIPTPDRSLLPFICFKPTEEWKNCVEISACGTDAGTFDCFRSEDRQGEMEAVLKTKDQPGILAISAIPSDDTKSVLHKCAVRQVKAEKNEHAPVSHPRLILRSYFDRVGARVFVAGIAGNRTKPRWLKAPLSLAENNVMSGWAGGAGAQDRATLDGQWPGETPIRPSLMAFSAGTVVGPADDHSGLLEMASEASLGINREASRCSSHHHPSLQFALFADAGQGCER